MSECSQLVINAKKPATGLLLKRMEMRVVMHLAWPYKAALIYAFNLAKLNFYSTMNEKCSQESPRSHNIQHDE